MKTIRMEQMTSPEIKAAIASGFTTAIVAIGSTEQHGPHLPTMTDAPIWCYTVARAGVSRGCRAVTC